MTRPLASPALRLVPALNEPEVAHESRGSTAPRHHAGLSPDGLASASGSLNAADDDLVALAYALLVAHAVDPGGTVLVGRGLDVLETARKERAS